MMKEEMDRLSLRIPTRLHEYLKARAGGNNRSVNAEITTILQEAQRRAELPGVNLDKPIIEQMLDLAANLPDAPEYHGEGHA